MDKGRPSEITKVLVTSSFIPNEFAKRHRLLEQLRDEGFDVTVAGHLPEGQNACQELDIEFALIPFDNGKIGLLSNLKVLSGYYRLMRKERFDVVHSYTAKPNIFGSIAARLAGIKHIYPTVNGLGYAFVERPGIKAKALRATMLLLYKIAFACAEKVFFQNPDDMEELQKRGIVSERKCVLVSGSGVDLEAFPFLSPGPEKTFLFATRLLESKGIRTYASAARIVKRTYPDARFLAAGTLSSYPDSITEEELQRYIDLGTLEFLGEAEDMALVLKDCSVVVLPSFYREGIPHVLLEGMSAGRAILTTDMPGCREAFNGDNGFLVEPNDDEALATKMIWMIEHPDAVQAMGMSGREYAEKRFDVRKVNAQILKAMGMWSE